MSNMNIYVGNLALSVTEGELRTIFTRFGEVTKIMIKNDHHLGNGHSTGYGYVEMPSIKEGNSAIAGLNGKTFRGQTLTTIEAMPMSSDPIKERRRRGAPMANPKSRATDN
ncbi:MAG: RNA recognition motif domain-containing protein [Dehalogenimonas sp.]